MSTPKKRPWIKSYPEYVTWDALNIPEKPVYDIFDDACKFSPDNPCLYFLGRRYTYKDIDTLIAQTTKGLQNLGVGKGDKVGLCLPNCPYYVIAYFAILKTGATVVNFNPLYTEKEIAAQIRDSGTTHMFTLEMKQVYDKVATSLGRNTLKHVIVCPLTQALPTHLGLLAKIFKAKEIAKIPKNKHHTFFKDLISHGTHFKPTKIHPNEDIALIQYTGGTTGIPKGALLTHANVYANSFQVKAWLGELNPKGEKFLGVIPFFHVFAMTAVMNLGLACHAEIILMPRFELKKVIKAIVKLRPTIFPAVPTIFSAINNYPNVELLNLRSIRYCISGGAGLPAQVRERFEELTGCELVEGYGLSEASPVLTCNPPSRSRTGSIGLPLPGTDVEIRDLEDKSKTVKQGERGELVAKGPQVMKAYLNRPEETEETVINDWLLTGDVGFIDEDGFIHLTDRLKEIIISNGYNIYPRIIEDALYLHPDVEEVIVIGVADENKGEVPKGFVKLKADANITEEELLNFVKEHLNPLERPATLEFRTELPKTLIGKLSKKELIEEEKSKHKI